MIDNKSVIILDHLLFFDADYGHSTGLNLMETLQRVDNPPSSIQYIAHCLEGTAQFTNVQVNCNTVLITKARMHKFSLSRPVNYLLGILHSMWITCRFHRDSVVAVNPVNWIAAQSMKAAGTVRFVVYYSADYSPKRSNNRILSFLYLYLDSLAVKCADETWAVSKEICAIRKNQGAKRVRLVTNAPVRGRFIPKETLPKNFKTIVYSLGKFTGKVVQGNHYFEDLFRSIKECHERFSSLKLRIVGFGNYADQLVPIAIKYHALELTEFFDARSRDEYVELIESSSIGIALYNVDGGASHLAYGDSMKIREYVASGLPVITTCGHAMASEVTTHKLGIVIDTPVNLDRALTELLLNDSQFNEYRLNAIRYGQENDNIIVLSEALQSMPKNLES